MRLGTSPTTTITVPGNGGHLGSSQSIADTQYSATNHPFLKGNESVYNINNPKLGMLQNFVPQESNVKKFEGLEYFTKQSPRGQLPQTTTGRARTKKLAALKSNPRYYKQKALFFDATSFSTDPTVVSPGSQMLIGNKTLIMRDLLNKKLDEQHKKSLSKTGAPFDKAKQTYYMDEQEFPYDPKVMAEGTHRQEVEEMMSVKHVYKQQKKESQKKKLNNYTSKNQLVWNNEQHLENVSNYLTQSQFCAPSIGMPLSTRGPFSHRGTTANQSIGTPGILNKTINESESRKINQQSETMDLRSLESGTSFLPVSAPAAGFRGQGSQTTRNKTNQSKQKIGQHKILIDDCNGYPTNLDLNEDSIVLTPREGRNLYSQDQSLNALGPQQSKYSSINKSFQQEPDSSLISVFRTNNSSKDTSLSPKAVTFYSPNGTSEGPRPTVYTYREKNTARNKQHDLYRSTARVAEFGVHVPHYLESDGREVLKSHYLKQNMAQLKVIKKQSELDPNTYTNDRGYIFYAPSDPPLDRQIIETGGRVFDYKVEHQQKRLDSISKDIIPSLDMKQSVLNESIKTRQDIREIISFEKMTMNSQSKFGFSMAEFSEISQSSISKPLKKGRNAFKDTLKHPLDISKLKYLNNKKKINMNYTQISRSSSIEKFSKTSRVALSTDRSEALDKYYQSTRQSNTTLQTVNEQIQPSKVTYKKNLKQLDNCSPERIESISKSLSKLQKLRHHQNTSNEAKQYKKFQNTKSNFAERVYESNLNNLIKRSLMPINELNIKKVFGQSVTPNNMKQMANNSKAYLEAKAMYNLNRMSSFNSQEKPAAGVPAQRLSPAQSISVPHTNQEVVKKSTATYNMVTGQGDSRNFSQPPAKQTSLNGYLQSNL